MLYSAGGYIQVEDLEVEVFDPLTMKNIQILTSRWAGFPCVFLSFMASEQWTFQLLYRYEPYWM
jgi:hypothetical protein